MSSMQLIGTEMHLRIARARILAGFAAIALILATSCVSVTGRESSAKQVSKPNAWITIKDKTGSCQMSVPQDWVPSTKVPGHVFTSDHTESMIISGFQRELKPMSRETQKAVGVDKIFENTPSRWFYALRPIPGTGDKPSLVVYHVEVQQTDRTCIAQILVRQDHSEDEIKKIAASVSGRLPAE